MSNLVKPKIITQSLSSLVTLFGQNSSVVKHILDLREKWQVDTPDTIEYLNTFALFIDDMKTLDRPTKNWQEFDTLPRGCSVIEDVENIKNTVANQELSGGYYIELPTSYKIFCSKTLTVESNKIYVPRDYNKCWQHPCGQHLITPGTTQLNNVISSCYQRNKMTTDQFSKSVWRYLIGVSTTLTGKNGLISRSILGLSYPYGARGKAMCSKYIEPFNIAIPAHVANNLKLREGDLVLGLRYPDLGNSSWTVVRIQEILHHKKWQDTIVVGQNSWGATNLDFDGDVIYILSVKGKEEYKEMVDVYIGNDRRGSIVRKLNDRKPFHVGMKGISLDEFDITDIDPYDVDTYVAAVSGLNAVKLRTGPTIGYLYAIQRLLEYYKGYKGNDTTWRVEWEETFRSIAQKSIGAKHGEPPVFEHFQAAVDTIDRKSSIDTLLKLGVPKDIVKLLWTTVTSTCQECRGCRPSQIKRASTVDLLVNDNHHLWKMTRTTLFPGNLIVRLTRMRYSKDTRSDITKWLWDTYFEGRPDNLLDFSDIVKVEATKQDKKSSVIGK